MEHSPSEGSLEEQASFTATIKILNELFKCPHATPSSLYADDSIFTHTEVAHNLFPASFEAETLLDPDDNLGEPCSVGHEVVPPSLPLDVGPYFLENDRACLLPLMGSELGHNSAYRRLDHRGLQST